MKPIQGLLPLWLAVASSAAAAPLLLDMGTAQSAVWYGCTRVTPQNLFSEQSGFGWQTTEGLRTQARAYTNLVENRSRGRDEPPPIWTNPITEDGIFGDRENSFLFQAPPGDYELYVLCATSEAMRSQFFDFTGVSLFTRGTIWNVSIRTPSPERKTLIRSCASSLRPVNSNR